MRTFLMVMVALLFTYSGIAQKTADIGLWGGASTYWGDMTKVNFNQSVNPMIGAYFRYNFNSRASIRAIYLGGKVGAVGELENIPWNFDKTVHDFSVQMEINYLKYILGIKKTPFSPYILGGVGVMYYNYNLDPAKLYPFNPSHNKGDVQTENSVTSLTLPFGMGIKTHIGDRFGIGLEVLFRKLFNDKLDNLDDPMAYIKNGKEVTYTDFLHNNDYTAYLGIHLTYMIFSGQKPCPAYDSKN